MSLMLTRPLPFTSSIESFLHMMVGEGTPSTVTGIMSVPSICTVQFCSGTGSRIDGASVVCVREGGGKREGMRVRERKRERERESEHWQIKHA